MQGGEDMRNISEVDFQERPVAMGGGWGGTKLSDLHNITPYHSIFRLTLTMGKIYVKQCLQNTLLRIYVVNQGYRS